ncbi:MAG: V-type ATP synthase subunit I [Bacteroidaceae bacterium]|jgi:V/A-type H+-transporting ATPase subunit I|nr:V-type ATP synthase subunit I [Bacteroidaceae bacterium]
MITKMKKISFLAFHKGYEEFLEHLRNLGIVHVVEKQEGVLSDESLQESVRLMQRYQNAMDELQKLADKQVKAGAERKSAEEILAVYEKYVANKQVLEQKLQSLNRDAQQLQVWGDFSGESIQRLNRAGYVIKFFTSPLKSFKQEWVDEYNAIEIYSDKQKICFVTITPLNKVVDIDAELCQLPESSLSEIESETAKVEQLLKENLQTAQSVAGYAEEVLSEAKAALDSSINFGKVKLSGESVVADKLILLEGWVPAEKVDSVSSELKNLQVLFDIEDPTPEDNIPIQLKNNKFAKLFEPLTKLYMLPTYQELDLTLFFAPFFMLFFGLCLGDMGYGLLMIVGLPIFTKLFQLINPNFSKWLVVLFGASTILCGTLSGSFFGFSIYDIDIPFVQNMKELLYTDNSTMFTVSLCIGVVQILFGMIIKAVNLTIQCGFKNAISTIGWIVLLLTVIVAVLLKVDFSNPIIIALLAISGIGIFLLNSPGKNPLLNIGLGLWDTYNMATGLLGDVLSYVRLFALGLSGGILANVFNSMAVGMSPDIPVVGFIVTALIFAIGHALNIFMNILGAIVHPMRLTFVEFFKNAGYEGGGVEYKPFSK